MVSEWMRVDSELYEMIEKLRKHYQENGIDLTWPQATKLFAKELKKKRKGDSFDGTKWQFPEFGK